MTHEQFYEFCQANRDLRIERTADAEVIVMPPASSDIGDCNFNLAIFTPICPDFVMALRSASDSLTTLQAKMQEYIDNSALLGWLIDRKQQKVYLYCPNQLPEILENPEAVSGDPKLPGFALQIQNIW
jgi:Uma2 family endonuclease